jgi:hypothetical protein
MTTTGERTLISVVIVLLLILAFSQAVWAKEGKANPNAGCNLLIGNR